MEASSATELLRKFLSIQSLRASIYSRLNSAFLDYLENGGEVKFQEACNQITTEFSDCSKQVINIETILKSPEYDREDLAKILQSLQIQEKQKLHMTVQIQLLKKVKRPSERAPTHVHVHETLVVDGFEDVEAESEYDAALNEAIKGVQDAVIAINEHIEEIRYEIEDMESQEM